jgi:hypothetical protein
MAGDRRTAVARMADIDRRFRHAAADADRHQHRLAPSLRKPCGRLTWFSIQHHVPGGPNRASMTSSPQAQPTVSTPWSTRKCSTTLWNDRRRICRLAGAPNSG